ncbi:MAG: mechanosensitive ion channel [Paracoccaceae bacterium]|nr:mechanosensitive ion channel [Paracoccaceae bacterium]
MDWSFLLEIALNMFYAILIFIVAWVVSGWVRKRIISVSSSYEQIDDTFFGFLGNVLRYTILAFALLFVLSRFGIQTTSIIAMIGAAGLAVGLALQGTLSNFAAGVMLVVFRPVKVGDYVEIGGKGGTVKEITLFFTELATPGNVQIIVPNNEVWSASIINHSYYDVRRIALTFGVDYASDLKLVESVLLETITADERIHAEPEPYIRVVALNSSSIDFVVRVWCDSSDYWVLRHDLTRAVKDAFDANGIQIPFPAMTLYRSGQVSPDSAAS